MDRALRIRFEDRRRRSGAESVAHSRGLQDCPVLVQQPTGASGLILQLAGAWSGFAAPRVTGKAQLQSVRAEVRGMNAPLEISFRQHRAPTMIWSPFQNLSAATSTIAWHGSLTLPRPCGVPSACLIHFDLHADQLGTDQLNQLLNPHAVKRPWYRFLTADAQGGMPYLARVHAAGRISTDRLLVRGLVATKGLCQSHTRKRNGYRCWLTR